MTALSNKRQRIRERDGDDCWLCGKALNFDAVPNSKSYPTTEHLQPISLGGTNALENLRLCHPGCNRQLGDRPRPDKERMRERRIAKAANAVEKQSVSVVRSGVKTTVPAIDASTLSATAEADWRLLAFATLAVASFFAGLSLGLLLR